MLWVLALQTWLKADFSNNSLWFSLSLILTLSVFWFSSMLLLFEGATKRWIWKFFRQIAGDWETMGGTQNGLLRASADIWYHKLCGAFFKPFCWRAITAGNGLFLFLVSSGPGWVVHFKSEQGWQPQRSVWFGLFSLVVLWVIWATAKFPAQPMLPSLCFCNVVSLEALNTSNPHPWLESEAPTLRAVAEALAEREKGNLEV